MATSNTPMILSKSSQEGLIQFHKQCTSLLSTQWNIREQLRASDLAYMRETDQTKEHQRAKVANTYGDSTKFQNLVVPVVKPLVESAVTYQTSVFLTGNPIFGVVADPAFEDEALQMETVIANQSTRGGWVSHLMGHFRNGFKYNLAALEVDWSTEVTPTLETDLTFSTKQAKPKEVIWSGNRLQNLDLYNTFWDARVAPVEVPVFGEFAGYTKLYSRIALKKFIASLPDKIIANVIPAFESGVGGSGINSDAANYYVPDLNPNAVLGRDPRGTMDWLAWAGISKDPGAIRYQNMYEVSVLYARIMPSDFNMRVPSANTPQVWKLIIVNHQVLIYSERLTNAHGLIPILFSQPYEDGLGYQTKSLCDDVLPMQSLSSALANSWIASRRRAISDRVVYDPSRISPEQMNSPNPSAKIPCRPSAYGKNVAEAVYQFPFRDEQAATSMTEMQQIQQFAFVLSGQNQAKQGQFVKGNKTLHEYADVMSHANGNDQKVALLYESQLFTPLKEMLKINILQYQGAESLLSADKKQMIQIDPVKLRKAVMNFKVSDGLIPSEKLINGEAWTTALQVIGSTPTINEAYNMAPMFSYLMKTQGADLSPFEKTPQQQAYEQAMGYWQQVVMEGMKQGIKQENLPPQPMPQAYGYDPAKQQVAGAAKQVAQTQQSQQPANGEANGNPTAE